MHDHIHNNYEEIDALKDQDSFNEQKISSTSQYPFRMNNASDFRVSLFSD